MLSFKTRILTNILIITALLGSGFATLTYGQMGAPQPCETCTMTVGSDAQAHLKVFDSTGKIHYADCLVCAFKMLRTYGELTITVTCDWNGPDYPITIRLQNFTNGGYVNNTVFYPSTALFIDGGCAKNRVVYDQVAADALLSHNGVSQYVVMMQNITIPSNSTVMTIQLAAQKYAFVSTPDLTPTPTPAPTITPAPIVSPNPTTTTKPTQIPTPTSTPNIITAKTCNVCGMDVTSADQVKYKIVDGNGTVHYAECYMCALDLVKKYDKLTITSYCDWYGPNYTVTVESQQFGKEVKVSPSTAMFLNGGSCVINRVAYNQTAADALLAGGFSKYSLPEQHYDLPNETNVTTVNQAALALTKNTANQTPIGPLIIGALAGVAIIALSVIAYKKLKFK